jgi:hypothetical protein
VAIQEVSQEQFIALNLFDHCRALWPEEHERGWFVDASEQLIGVLLEDRLTGLWGYSICRYRDDGHFHRIAVAADIPGAGMARMALVASMRRELAA